MILPVDTYVIESKFAFVEGEDGFGLLGCGFFIETQYLSDLLPGQHYEIHSGTFGAVNGQEPEGNGISGVFATEAEAEAYLVETFALPYEDDPYEGDSSGFNPPQYA